MPLAPRPGRSMPVRTRLLHALNAPVRIVLVESFVGVRQDEVLIPWSEATGQDQRILVSVPFETRTLSQLMTAAVQKLASHGPSTDSAMGTSVTEALSEMLARANSPVTVCLSDIDGIDQNELAGLMVELCRAAPAVRFIVGATDVGSLRDELARTDVSYSVVAELELLYTYQECYDACHAMIEGALPEQSVEWFFAESMGYPAVIREALTRVPELVRRREVDRLMMLDLWWEAAIHLRLAHRTGTGSVVQTEAHLEELLPAPRLSLDEAAYLIGSDCADQLLARALSLKMWELRHHAELDVPVIIWDRRVREWKLSAIGTMLNPDSVIAKTHRVIEAAMAFRDHELALLAHVSIGELDLAEQIADRHFWDLATVTDTAPWQEAAARISDDISRYPNLHVLMSVLGHERMPVGFRARLRGAKAVRGVVALMRSRDVSDLTELRDLGQGWLSRVGSAKAGEPAEKAAVDIAEALGVADALAVAGDITGASVAGELAIQQLSMLNRNTARARRQWGRARLHVAHRLAILGETSDDRVKLSLTGSFPGMMHEGTMALRQIVRAWQELDSGDTDSVVEVTTELLSQNSASVHEPEVLLLRALALATAGDVAALTPMKAEAAALAGRSLGNTQYPFAEGIDLILGIASSGRVATTIPDTSDYRQILAARISGLQRGSARLPVSIARAGSRVLPRLHRVLMALDVLDALRMGDLPRARLALTRAFDRGSGSQPVWGLALLASDDELMWILGELQEWAVEEQSEPLRRLIDRRHAEHETISIPALTKRDRALIQMISAGMTNAQIAEELVVSVHTVKFHRANLYKKLGIHRRQELLAVAVQLGY